MSGEAIANESRRLGFVEGCQFDSKRGCASRRLHGRNGPLGRNHHNRASLPKFVAGPVEQRLQRTRRPHSFANAVQQQHRLELCKRQAVQPFVDCLPDARYRPRWLVVPVATSKTQRGNAELFCQLCRQLLLIPVVQRNAQRLACLLPAARFQHGEQQRFSRSRRTGEPSRRVPLFDEIFKACERFVVNSGGNIVAFTTPPLKGRTIALHGGQCIEGQHTN